MKTVSILLEHSHWRDYLALTKPKVVLLITFTAIVGMLLATPTWVPLPVLVGGSLGIALAAASAAALNHLLDRRIDALMARTRYRPLPRGQLDSWQVLSFAGVLALGAAGLLLSCTNLLATGLTFAALLGYAGLYTVFLKRATPQNIVIGGAAGAAPPLLGWVAVTGEVQPLALLLFLIIFTWTPPHFWALAIARREDYAKAEIPMLPVTHGVAFTQLQIVLYTILLNIVALFPYLTGECGLLYLCVAVLLGARFLWYTIGLYVGGNDGLAMPTFSFSIVYLFGLFAALMVDHYLRSLLA